MSIPNHILEQLNSQADLVSIIGRHTTLKRSGNEFRGCCPFHGEKSPSFFVNPQKNMYHCFGCQAGGNALGFLRDYENLTFMEAVEELSRQTGIEVPKEDRQNIRYKKQAVPKKTVSAAHHHAAETPAVSHDHANYPQPNDDYGYGAISTTSPAGYEFADRDFYQDLAAPSFSEDHFSQNDFSQRFYDSPPDYLQSISAENPVNDANDNSDGNLYELLEQICKFYQDNLSTHAHAKHYFTARGISDEIIKTFALGYAPFGWQHLEQAFPEDIEGLKLLGLVRKSDSGRDYDLLRDRVIFPIKDNQGRIIGFAGRALDDEVKPKYINSSDSPVFHKQHVLYGYYESRQQRANDWLVVEGYMDVIALYQAGIYGAVASMGTAVNEQQIARLLQLNPTLTLSFDGDSAGQKAAWRTLEISLPILSDDKELRFLTLPNNHDPDTFIKAYGADAMREHIASAMPLSQYIFAYLSTQHDLGLAEGKAKLMAQVRKLGALLPKGSSFRYLLNNDIYQKLGGKRNQNRDAKDALLNFDGGMTTSQHLQLCFLFQPQALVDDPIQTIWQQAGIDKLNLPEHIKTKAPSDASRTLAWADLQDAELLDVVSTIQRCQNVLPNDINAAAHFILSNLNPSTRQQLSAYWVDFYQALIFRNILEIDGLIEELVSGLLERHMKNKHKQLIKNPDIITMTIVRSQAQLLKTWLRAYHAEQSAQMMSI